MLQGQCQSQSYPERHPTPHECSITDQKHLASASYCSTFTTKPHANLALPCGHTAEVVHLSVAVHLLTTYLCLVPLPGHHASPPLPLTADSSESTNERSHEASVIPSLACVSEAQALKIEAIASEQVCHVIEQCCFLCAVREKANTIQRA